MGIRVEVRDGESVGQAYKRFRELLWRHGPPGAGRKRPKWHKRPLDHHLKASELARRDELRDAFETYSGECARRRLVCDIRRRTKRRKERFGDAPVVCKYPQPPSLPWCASIPVVTRRGVLASEHLRLLELSRLPPDALAGQGEVPR